jgi:Flp pilus assembly protein CpaB
MGILKTVLLFVLAGFTLTPLFAQQQGPRAGYRAINLSLDSDYVFYLSPGDTVDALAVFGREPGAGGRAETVGGTLIKMKQVLAVTPSGATLGKTVVRLEANANEAQYLETAAQAGTLWLTLRKKGDVNDHPLQYAAWGDELKPGLRALAAPRARAVCAASAGGGVSADAALAAAVQGRMQENFPALSVPLATDKILGIKTGDRVDVLATIDAAQADGSKKHKRTLTLLQNIQVLDVRRSVCLPGQSVLLLAMNFKQAQYAALAWDTAEVQVLARGAGDTETHVMESASLSQLR